MRIQVKTSSYRDKIIKQTRPTVNSIFTNKLVKNIFHSCLDVDVGGEKDVDPEGAGEPPQ